MDILFYFDTLLDCLVFEYYNWMIKMPSEISEIQSIVITKANFEVKRNVLAGYLSVFWIYVLNIWLRQHYSINPLNEIEISHQIRIELVRMLYKGIHERIRDIGQKRNYIFLSPSVNKSRQRMPCSG